jgi:hypothetical protein
MLGMATGMDLRLERTAARVKLKDLASRMHRHPATLNRWELAAWLPQDRVDEYRRALATLASDATVDKAAA